MLLAIRASLLLLQTDSDWAGDERTRKSTSGGTLKLGSHTIQHWCKAQSNIALSSGEAELNSSVKGLSAVLGGYELMHELGFNQKIVLETDASACKGMLLKSGSGRVKHLTTKQLWVQGAIEKYGIEVKKIPRSTNHADLLTHHFSGQIAEDHLSGLGFIRRTAATPMENAAERGC